MPFCNETGTFLEMFLVYLVKNYLLNQNLQKHLFPKITFTNSLINMAEV